MQISPTLNLPQAKFLAMPHKYSAFVGGYGCVREDTKILTSRGFVPIADLQFGDEVVSYNETSQKFQSSLCSGGFVKGKATLYRIITTRGEFIASGHHLVRVGCNKYQQVDSLRAKKNGIICIERQMHDEWFWDIQVPGDNNYTTEDGTIHHNSGKTWVGCCGLAKHFYEHPRVDAGYFAPTYQQIRDIFYPTIEEALYDWGLSVQIKTGDHDVYVYRGRKLLGLVKCRSMDNPGTIVGFKIGKALVDEIDLLPMKKAQYVWRKVLARMRFKGENLDNGIDVTTTPEGFRFVYNQFVKQVRDKPELAKRYGLIQASTRDNAANLPSDYIDSLIESYPPELIDAYIDGKFTNLQTGTVYKQFSRDKNCCTDTVTDSDTVLDIGMDFNVGKMAAIVHKKVNSLPRAVDEIINAYDTPDMIKRIKERYWKFNGRDYERTRQIRVYPDSSGDSRKTVNASETDIALLRQAGFVVCAPNSNPPVKDRINSMNAMFLNAAGERRYLVNLDKCPTYAEALEQQAYSDNGEPDKTTGHDHPVDAAGYYIRYEYPVVKRTFSAQQPTGGRRL